MFSGNNNTSYRLTAYLCKNSARGGIWSALVLFFEITSFRYVPVAVVMFSLPYQFCRDGKFYYRAYLVCHSQMPSLQVVFGGGAQAFFPRFPFFSRDSASVLLCMCGSPTTPILVMLKKKGMFSSKERKKKKAQSEKMTNLSVFVIGIYWLPLVHWLFITGASTTVSK